jgi:hypothetical protein
MRIITNKADEYFGSSMTVQSNAFQREDRHLATDLDLERPGAKRTRSDSNLAPIALAVGGRSTSPTFGFPSWPGLTRPSTRTPDQAIKQLIMFHKLESIRKLR